MKPGRRLTDRLENAKIPSFFKRLVRFVGVRARHELNLPHSTATRLALTPTKRRVSYFHK